MTTKYEQYADKLRRIADINYSAGVLHWDQEVNMPPKGAAARGRQLATLSGIAHQMFTDDAFGGLVKDLLEDDSLSTDQKTNVRETWKDYSRNKKLTQEFVEELARSVSESLNAWQEARSKSDFSLFRDHLEHLVELKLQEADMLGYEGHPYNALLDEYEPGATVAFLDPLFAGVRDNCSELLDKVMASKAPEIPFEGKRFDKDRQWPIGIELLKQMQYDFEAGRQDLSSHPFSTNFNANDVRVTTRINEDDILDMITSCIHEGGHALYEQGILPENYGLPSGQSISLGIHESQSRLWENNVARSREFWKQNFHLLKQAFPDEFEGCTADDVFHAANHVQPSLIRVQADELTYHFHILIRYEIEKAILEKAVKVKDLPSLWNEMYKQFLGIEVPDDARGVLQDIHWSHGSFGYFPTYSLGSFYAAQFFKQAEHDLGGLKAQIAEGNLLPLKKWLNDNIHQYGRLYTADGICRKVTGESLNVSVFMEYMEDKLGQVYGF